MCRLRLLGVAALLCVSAVSLTGGFAHAASTNDEIFASGALRELHKLAVASAQSERAAKESDCIGWRNAYDSLQKAAHEALTNMHQMSFAPITALKRVSILLRVSNLAQCPDDAVIRLDLPMLAGQAIIGLRTDYAIGDADWYMVNTSGDVEAKNPLRYAQSLSDQNYSWVDVRPKDMGFVGVSDWKAEMASHEVGDPAIENSGNNLKIVEVDYRKNSGDDNTYVYFYRTKEDAQAAAQASKQEGRGPLASWLELRKGVHAYTGAWGVDEVIVCNSAQAWLTAKEAAPKPVKQCAKKMPRGLPVTIASDEIAKYDLWGDFDYGVFIRADDASWSGWTSSSQLSPHIPANTQVTARIVKLPDGSEISLYLTLDRENRILGEILNNKIVEAVSQDPKSSWEDLYVSINNGAGNVRRGWLNSTDVTLQGGRELTFQPPDGYRFKPENVGSFKH